MLRTPHEARKPASAKKITDLNPVPDREQTGAGCSLHQTMPGRSESDEVETNTAKLLGARVQRPAAGSA